MAESARNGGGNGNGSDTEARARIKARLADLDDRLGGVKSRKVPETDGEQRGSALGLAFRITTELVAGVVVGGFIGWLLDRWLGTSPFLLLVFFVLGAAAGILNVMRTAREMQATAGPAGDEQRQSGSPPDGA